jgi:threonine dehydrogenase-like Zn-dependent dehydrogenase
VQLLMSDTPGGFGWHEVPDPQLTDPGQALVRPITVASCDLDVAGARGRAPIGTGFAQGHEGIAEVLAVGDAVGSVAVGDRVVVPFQISCGDCRECRRGSTGSCSSVPPLSMYGLGGLAGRDGGGFLADTVLVPFADAMLVGLPAGLDPIAFASLSDNIPDGWRCVGPHAADLAACAPGDRRVLVSGGLSVGLYAVAAAVALGAAVDYVDTDPHRLAAAQALGASVHDRPLPDPAATPYPVTVSTRSQADSLLATLRLTWADGVCTDTGVFFEPVPMPLLAMYTRGVRLVTGRAPARAAIPEVLGLLAGVDLRPVVHTVADWADAAAAWTAMTGKTVIVR